MALADVLGHERVRRLLARALGEGRLPPSLLFAGPEGVGKRRVAVEVARALVCDRPASDACMECSPCRRVTRALEALADQCKQAEAAREPVAWNLRLHPDLILVVPAGESIRIEQVRALVGEVAERPFEARGRAIVIDDAHLMTEQAANTLLKSLEEPPPDTHFLLVTSAPEALLPTIRSRCQRLRFGTLPLPLVEGFLRERSVEPQAAALRARLSGGSLGAALAFDDEGYEELRGRLVELLVRVAAGLSELERIELTGWLAEPETDWRRVLAILRGLVRDVAALRAGAGAQALLNVDVAERLARLGASEIGSEAPRILEALAQARGALEGRAHRGLTMGALVETMCQPSRLRLAEATW